MSLIDRFCLPRCTALSRLGMAIAARMPMIAMTISSSIKVKPDSRFFIGFFLPFLSTEWVYARRRPSVGETQTSHSKSLIRRDRTGDCRFLSTGAGAGDVFRSRPRACSRRKERVFLDDVRKKVDAVQVVAKKDPLVVAVAPRRVGDVRDDRLVAVSRDPDLPQQRRGGVAAVGRNRSERDARIVGLGDAPEQIGERRRVRA